VLAAVMWGGRGGDGREGAMALCLLRLTPTEYLS
jgi:hypothetical protein